MQFCGDEGGDENFAVVLEAEGGCGGGCRGGGEEGVVRVVWPGSSVEACVFNGGGVGAGGRDGVASDEDEFAADAVQVGDAVLSVPE